MTNHWNDLQNTDVALIMGGNPAENHPISFKWLMKAKEKRNAKFVVVDPRISRSATLADQYVPIRPGTDLALMGWLIKEILEKELYNKEYVLTHTNGPFLIDDAYSFSDGLFSGYNAEKKTYDKTTWAYKKDAAGKPLKDPTLQDPRCVINIMKEHYKRYTQDVVMKVTGCSNSECMDKLLEIVSSTAAKDKSMVIMYAMGTTQHTVGSQNVRAFAVLQLLLGNMGVPGGGIAAMRGESNVQGSTDMGLLFHLLPGYLGSPDAKAAHATLDDYLKAETPPTGFWSNKPKFMISLLKAWFGDKATKENGYLYDYIPKKNPDRPGGYSHIALFEAMYKGDIKGAMIFGANPIVGGPNANKEQEALTKLDWLVAVDLWETETSVFWKPEAWQKSIAKKPEDIKTEVFLLPACGSYEKEGTVSNSSRWVQYRWKSAEPVGESMSDMWIINQIMERVKKLYASSTDPKDKPIQDLTWNYGHGHEPDVMLVAKEMNGYTIADGKPLSGIGALKDDGTTACGLWVWAGIMPEEGKYRAKDRDNNDKSGIGQYSNWAYAWPANRRIVYNRASADAEGKPWSEAKKLLWWDPTMPVDAKDPNSKIGRWTGLDIPDIGVGTAPNDPTGAGVGGFFMRPENVGCMFSVPSAVGTMNEGPLPEHYEPWESPFANLLSKQNLNPVVKVWEPDKQSKKDKYPIIGTTYRLTEHWQSGTMTRNLPWLAEIVPNVYVEMSESLAKEKGIKSGDKVIVSNARGEITAYAMVTKRLKPFKANGESAEVIGVIWHFGFNGVASGDPANRLTPHVGDGNTMIPEYKAWLCDVRRA